VHYIYLVTGCIHINIYELRFLSRLYLQTDGYASYNAVVTENGLSHVGCLAHARRKLSDAVKAQGENKKRGQAHRGLALIQKIYRIEKQSKKLPKAKTVEDVEALVPGYLKNHQIKV
jgi:hypothetical protein